MIGFQDIRDWYRYQVADMWQEIRQLDIWNWHRYAVGGMWEEIGQLQFDFLVAWGLQPEHYLLDVGCGSLRGGVHFVEYLAAGHYHGIDKSRALLQAGRNRELKSRQLLHKNPILQQVSNFDFSALNQTFDYALAQSLFTHLTLNSIVRCLRGVEQVLRPGGRFYATFYECPQQFSLEPIEHQTARGPVFLSHCDRDPFHYSFDTFKWLCEDTKLCAEYIGNWGHPRDQRMVAFIKTR